LRRARAVAARRGDPRRPAVSTMAARVGLIACRVCGMLNRARADARAHCARCGSALHARKPDSLARATAFLVAAYVLYLPANLLPIHETGALGDEAARDTILSGAVKLWLAGWWP